MSPPWQVEPFEERLDVTPQVVERVALFAEHRAFLPHPVTTALLRRLIGVANEIARLALTREDSTAAVADAQELGLKAGQMFQPIRVAVCGRKSAPPLFETLEVLGVHCFGDNASEIVHIGQTVMGLGGTVDYLIDQVFNYPTLAESYKVAALDATNKLRALNRLTV